MATMATPTTVAVEVLREQVLTLRAQGATYRQIATAANIAVSYAHELVIEALEELRTQTRESTEQVRELELTRLDAMIVDLNTRLEKERKVSGSLGVNPKTVESLLKVAESRRKLLGVDAPSRWEGSGPDGGPIPIANVDNARDVFLERIMQRMIRGASVKVPAEAAAAELEAAGPQAALPPSPTANP